MSLGPHPHVNVFFAPGHTLTTDEPSCREVCFVKTERHGRSVFHSAVDQQEFVHQPRAEKTFDRGRPTFDEQPLHLLVAQLLQKALEVHVTGQMHRGASVGEHRGVLWDASPAVEHDPDALSEPGSEP